MAFLRILRAPRPTIKLKLLFLANILGLLYFLLMITTTTILGIYKVLPAIYASDPDRIRFHTYIGYFFLINTLGNFILGACTDSSVASLDDNILPSKQRTKKLGFRVCKRCDVRIPARSHHCVLCNTCILKRDHHCFFMCACVGYYNHKYFIMYCFYQFLAGLYAAVLALLYLKHLYGVHFTGITSIITLLTSTIYDYLFFESIVSSYHLFLVSIFYGCMAAGLCAGGFFYWQLAIVFFGQTTYESRTGIEDYSGSFRENFIDVFGPYWFLSLMLPLPLPQSGNGVYMPKDLNKKGS